MARSLTVQHEENPSTSPLLTGFLLFAVAWLVLGTFLAGAAEAEADTAAADVVAE